MGGNVSYRMETSPVDRVSHILKTVNANRSNLDRAFEELYSISGAPMSKAETDEFVNKLIADLVERLDNHQTKYFPDVSDKELREKIFPPLREYVENTHDKLIVREHGKDRIEVGISYPGNMLNRGEINIHPILVHLHGLEKATKAKVSYGPTSISFSPIRHNTYYKYPGSYLGFHETDISDLFRDSILELMEKNTTVREFNIELDPLDSSGKTAVIKVEKVKPVIMPPIPDLFAENVLKAIKSSQKENLGEKDEGISAEEISSKIGEYSAQPLRAIDMGASKADSEKIIIVNGSSRSVQSSELPLELPENLVDVKKSATELHRLSGSMFEPYKSLLSERETLIGYLVDGKLHKESFFKEITEEWHKVGDILETEPLGKSEYTAARLFIQSIATDIINYVSKREKEINELRQKHARANAR